MDFDEIIRQRTATRLYKDKKVEKEKINKILEAGRVAPTARNLQPQIIYVIETEESLKKIDNITPSRHNAQLCLLVCSDKKASYKKDEFDSYQMDATIVATHMILEATNLGVDNLWIRNFTTEAAIKEFNLEENIVPICILAMGYKDDNCPINPLHKDRKDLNKIVEFI